MEETNLPPQNLPPQVSSFIQRAILILTKPNDAWVKFKSDGASINSVFMSYVLPLVLIPLIIAFPFFFLFNPFRYLGVFGYSLGVGYPIAWLIMTFILQLGAIFLDAFIINALAPSFGSKQDMPSSFKLVAYSMTPTFIASLFKYIPVLNILISLAGAIYAIYILYLGFTPMMETPKDKVPVYMIVSIVILIVVYAIISLIVTGILSAIFLSGAILHSM